jgi:ribosome-associated translation inhibitor RaiA
MSVEVLGHNVSVDEAASHRFEVRIDKFTNHDDLLQRVERVNNIWLEANQCLTARVDA